MTAVEALSPEMQQYIDQALAEGRYSTPQAVLSDAVQLLQERDRRLREMREAVEDGYRSLEEGEPIVIRDKTELRSFFNELRREGGLPERGLDD